MNLQFKSDPLTQDTMDSITRGFTEAGLTIEASYLKNGRPVKEWQSDVNGLQIKLDNGKKVYQSHKTTNFLWLKNVPEQYHAPLLAMFKQHNIVQAPEFGLGMLLTLIFVLLGLFIVAVRVAPESSTFAGVMIVALIMCGIGLVLLNQSPIRKEGNNSLFIVAMVLYFIGALAFVPSSLLTMPLMRALIQKRSYHFFQ